MYTKEDQKIFKHRDIKPEQIDRQLDNFKKGFDFIKLSAPATIGNGIQQIAAEEEEGLLALHETASKTCRMVKMVPASGSASRMFKDLFAFMESYKGEHQEFLDFVQHKGIGTMHEFFTKLNEFPFYTRLRTVIWESGEDLDRMISKRQYVEILEFLLTKKGLNYGNTPKGLVDFHVYRDFVRTAFDEHIAESALYCSNGKEARMHFTVSEEYLSQFKEREKKVGKVFEKMFSVKYNISYSVQKPSTDMVSIDDKNELVRDSEGKIVFRPGGHGALIHNLDDLDADVVFIKNIDNVRPDRSKVVSVRYKKMLAGKLLQLQSRVFDYLHQLDKKITNSVLDDIEKFVIETGCKKPENLKFKDQKERVKYLEHLLNRPMRVCGMVKNEGQPGGGPFWVKEADGGIRLMIVESAQVNLKDKEEKKIFEASTHFNPVDLVCGLKNYKGKKFDLEKFVDGEQGFITNKSYKGKNIKVQELPGLWNGSMAQWITVFVEVPLCTFTPVKTVFDLQQIEHRNVLKRLE